MEVDEESPAAAAAAAAEFSRKLLLLAHADSSDGDGGCGCGASDGESDSSPEIAGVDGPAGGSSTGGSGQAEKPGMSAGRSPCRSWCSQRCEDSQSGRRQPQRHQAQSRPQPTSPDCLELRSRVCQEIVGTERRYCCCLRIIIDLLAQTVKASACISVKNLCLIFPRSLPRLHELHSAFLVQLELRLHSETADNFSSAVLHFLDTNGAELLSLYRDYANDYRCALATLLKCQSRSSRLRRLLRCLQRHPSCQGLDLPAYLLTPVQRTPRYLLLLAQLRANTPEGHPDLPGLVGAIDRLRHLLDGLDVSIHSALKQHPHHHQHQLAASRQHQSRKSQPSFRPTVGSSDSLHRLGRFVRQRAESCDTASQLHQHHFLGTQQRRDTQPELQLAAAATGRMGPRSQAISRQLRAADRCHSAGDILRQQRQQQTAAATAAASSASFEKTTSPIQPAPLATWEEPPAPPELQAPTFSGPRRRAKSTSSKPTVAIKESLRRVFLMPRRKSSASDLYDCLGGQL